MKRKMSEQRRGRQMPTCQRRQRRAKQRRSNLTKRRRTMLLML